MSSSSNDLTSSQLCELIEKDKDAVIEYLYEKYSLKIINFVFYIVKNRHIAEEIAQETFIKTYRVLDSFRPDAKISTWIYQIAKGLSYNYIKHKRVEATVSLEKDIKAKGGTISLSEVLSDESMPIDSLLEEESQNLMKKAIQSLPKKYKEVVVLCAIQGMPYQEAASILKCSEYVIGVRLMRAKTQLYEILKQNRQDM